MLARVWISSAVRCGVGVVDMWVHQAVASVLRKSASCQLVYNLPLASQQKHSPALALTGLQRSLPPFTNLPRNMFFKNGLNEIWSWVTI